MARRRDRSAPLPTDATPPPRPAPSPFSPIRRALLLGAFAVALRWLFLAGDPYRKLFFSPWYDGDTSRFLQWARAMVSGATYDSGLPFHPPLMAGFFALFDGAVRAGSFPFLKGLVGAISALSVPLVYLIARRLAGETAAIVAALLSAASFSQMVLGTALNVEALYLPLLLGSLLLVLVARDSGMRRHWVAAGLLSGIATLGRAEHLPLVVLVAGWAVLAPAANPGPGAGEEAGGSGGRRRWPARLLPALLLLGTTVAVALPWGIRNFVSIGRWNEAHPEGRLSRFVLVTSYGPFNFALANHAAATGRFEPTLPDGSPVPGIDLEKPAHLELYRHGYRSGLGFLLGEPAAAARLAARKLALFAGGFSHGLLGRNWPAGLDGVRAPVDLWVPDRGWLAVPGILLGAAGLALATARNRWPGILLGIVVAHRLLLAVAFFGYARGGALLVPLAAIGVGVLVEAALLAKLGSAAVAAWLPRVAAGAATLLLLVQLFLSGSPVTLAASGSAGPDGRLIPEAEVRIRRAK